VESTQPNDLAAFPEFLRVDEYQRLMRVGRSVVYAAIKAGTLPSVKIGRFVRIPREAIQLQPKRLKRREPDPPWLASGLCVVLRHNDMTSVNHNFTIENMGAALHEMERDRDFWKHEAESQHTFSKMGWAVSAESSPNNRHVTGNGSQADRDGQAPNSQHSHGSAGIVEHRRVSTSSRSRLLN
jgi:excisionase family DNA binding protein